jgi:hypothetical protein
MNRSVTRRTVTERIGTASLVLIAFGAGHLAAKLGTSAAEEAMIAVLVVVAFVTRLGLAWRPTDQQPTDQQPTDQQPTDQQPTDQQPTDQQPTDQEPTDQQLTSPVASPTSSSDNSSRAVPNGVNTFDVICSPTPSEGALAVIHGVIHGMVRPTDLVVRHTDGRLLVLVDAAGDDVRESFESRANVHVHVALAAAGMSPVGLTLRPAHTGR